MKETPRILVVDDEAGMRESLVDWLSEEGYHVGTAEDGPSALALIEHEEWNALLVDLKMPGMDGLDVLRRVNEVKKDLPVIIMTAYATVDTAVQAMKDGAYDYVVKPFEPEEVILGIRKILAHQAIVKENILLKKELEKRYHFEDMVGKSHRMQEVFELIRTVAQATTTILIHGESGTGKELTARAIHSASPRKECPFVAVSCAALPETLLESELFGHEKGAFTGAVSAKKGRFELAEGGTIFLDDIADISPKTQMDLLRVLQEREIQRLGGTQTVKVNVRVIAATNKDLASLVAEGKFREDLLYRLNVITIKLPPLRERTEDIPHLIDHFISKFNAQLGKSIEGVSQKSLSLLMRYSWPGNVRELENVIEHAAVMATDDIVLPKDLPPHISQERLISPKGRTLEDVEKAHIEGILREANWNIKHAAEILGIHRATLYKKIEDFKLKPNP